MVRPDDDLSSQAEIAVRLYSHVAADPRQSDAIEIVEARYAGMVLHDY